MRYFLSNRPATSSVVICALLVISALSACGDDSTAETTTPITTAVATTEATTTTAATTTIAATTTTIATTTTEPGPDYPTYSEYLAALPAGTRTCNTHGKVIDVGDGVVAVGGPGAVVSIVDGQMTVFCPGAKLVAGTPFSGLNQFGEPLEVGALFSVNPDGSYVQLSSF